MILEEKLREAKILPLLVARNPWCEASVRDLLHRRRTSIIEVTLRRDGAWSMLTALARDPDLWVGAGTVHRPDQVERASAAGARFVVSPGLDESVLAAARSLGIDLIPGVSTATELMHAQRHDITLVKFFPAAVSGGRAWLKAMAPVFPHISYLPTGGITADSAEGYLQLPQVAAVGGSWMFGQHSRQTPSGQGRPPDHRAARAQEDR